MHKANMTELLAISREDIKPKALKAKMTKLAVKNKNDLSFKDFPEYLRTPTAEELIEMRQWAIDYKNLHRQASKREIRRAVQERFKIRIFR